MNCFTFAWRVWQWRDSKTYLMIRRSLWGWFPHFAVVNEDPATGDLVKREFVPRDPSKHLIPPLSFIGKVVTTTYQKKTQTEREP